MKTIKMEFLIILWVLTTGILCRNLRDISANKDGSLEHLEALNTTVEQSRVADMVPELLYGLHKEASQIGETLGEHLSYGLDEESWHDFINHPSANPENIMLQDYMNKMYRIFGKAASVLSDHGIKKRETQKTLNESQVLFNWFFEQFGDPTVQRFTEIMDSEQLDQATPPPPQNDADVVFVGERSYDISHRLANPSAPEDYRGQKVEYEIGNVGTHLYQRKVKYNRKIERKYEGRNQYKDENTIDKVYEAIKSNPTSKKTYEKIVKVESSPQLGYHVMNKIVKTSNGNEENTIDIGAEMDIEKFKKLAEDARRNHVKELTDIHANIGNSINEDNLTLRKREQEAKKLSDVESATSMPDMSLETHDNTVGDEGIQSFVSFPHSSDLSVGDRSLLLRNFKAALGKMTFAEETLCNFTNCSHVLGNGGEKSSKENMVADEAHISTTDDVESSSQANLQKDLPSIAEGETFEESDVEKQPKTFVGENVLVIENMVVDENLSTTVATESVKVNLHGEDVNSTIDESEDGSSVKDENDVEMQPMDSVSAVMDVKSLSRSPDRSRRATPSVVPNVNKDSSDVTSPNYGPELEEDDYNLMDDKIQFVAYSSAVSLFVICLFLVYWLIVYKRQQRTRKYDPNSYDSSTNA